MPGHLSLTKNQPEKPGNERLIMRGGDVAHTFSRATQQPCLTVGQRILDDGKYELTASEYLAFFLRICLRDLEYAVRRGNSAPVRTEKLVPRSVIAWVATDLLGSCELWNYSPGPQLNGLIRELLNVDSNKAGATRHVEEQKQAAFIIAQDPKVHTRELAKKLDVNASTISRWRRNPEFKKEVER